MVAERYNREKTEKLGNKGARYKPIILNNDRVSAAELQNRTEPKRSQQKIYRACDITERDLEYIISSSIPVDRHGNLTPSKASKLHAQFAGKRFSRQHISDVLAGKTEVSRLDLITLTFFIYSQTLYNYTNAKARYMSFIETTNRYLGQCLFGELYIANPYECFVLMCILSEDPLGTYADFLEMSYEPTMSVY